MEVLTQNAVYFIVAIAIIVILFVWAFTTNRAQKDFNTMTWVLIPVAIAINIAIGQLVVFLKLPVYLDSIGTVLVAVICGPWAGGLTGALANIIWGLSVDPNALPWWPVAFFIGFVAGWCAQFGLFKRWSRVAVAGFFVALTAAIVSAPIAIAVYGGITASGSSIITAYLLQTGRGVFEAVLSTNFLVEPVDKISTVFLSAVIIQGLSKRYVARFPRSENAQMEQDSLATIAADIAIVALVVILAAHFGSIMTYETAFLLLAAELVILAAIFLRVFGTKRE
jgi:energy-coupling factor transport system substrate-specific component